MNNPRRLILASASPRRQELLRWLGIPFEVLVSDVNEALVADQSGKSAPKDIVFLLALAKAKDVLAKNPDAVVIGADTIVVLDGEILGKPTDTADAHRMLSRLSGRTHEVYTGIAVVSSTGKATTATRTLVTFKPLSSETIEAYIKTGEPMDKAGAYGIQNPEISPVASIDGDYYNVVGLPLAALYQLLAPIYPEIIQAPPDQNNSPNCD